MKKDELIELLQRQVDFLQGKLDEALFSIKSLTLINEKQTATIEELRKQIASLEDVIRGKDVEVAKEKAAVQAVQRLQGLTSERQGKPKAESAEAEKPESEKKRTNNGAKRKTHPECEIETIEVEPDNPAFKKEAATFIGTCDVVRYTMIPMRFVKTVLTSSLKKHIFYNLLINNILYLCVT